MKPEKPKDDDFVDTEDPTVMANLDFDGVDLSYNATQEKDDFPRPQDEPETKKPNPLKSTGLGKYLRD